MRLPLLLAVLALSMSGCAALDGNGEEEVATASTNLTPATPPDPVSGSLEGVVLTPSGDGLAGARVAIPRLERNVSTDAAGGFRIGELGTGEHVLFVTAEGYESANVRVHTRDDTVTEVELTLVPLPEPYDTTRELVGFLSCDARYQTPVASNTHDCAAADPNHRDTFEFHVDPEGSIVVVELAWDVDEDPAAPALVLLAETVGYGAQDLTLGETASADGYARVVVPTDVMAKYYPDGGMMRAHVRLADEGEASLAFQKTFTLYVTSFHHGPGDADHSVFAG